jgi:hypothetical protein
LQNSYVLRILCFWGEGDWLGVGRGVWNIPSPFRGGIKYFPMFFFFGGGGGLPNFRVEFWNILHPPVHILYDRSLNSTLVLGKQRDTLRYNTIAKMSYSSVKCFWHSRIFYFLYNESF